MHLRVNVVLSPQMPERDVFRVVEGSTIVTVLRVPELTKEVLLCFTDAVMTGTPPIGQPPRPLRHISGQGESIWWKGNCKWRGGAGTPIAHDVT